MSCDDRIEMEFFKRLMGDYAKVAYDDVIAIDFSTDIDKFSKVQTKDGNWHEGVIIDIPKGEEQ